MIRARPPRPGVELPDGTNGPTARRRPRVAFVSLNPDRGGQWTSLSSLAVAVEGSGYDVEVFTPLFTGRPRELVTAQERLPPRTSWLTSWRPLLDLGRQAEGYDLVQLHLPHAALGFLGDILARRVRAPVVVYYESCLVRWSARVLRAALRYPEFFLARALLGHPALARLGGRRAARYVVSTRHQRDELRRLGYLDDQLTVIPNFSRMPGSVLHRPRRSDDGGFLIGYAGHLYPQKGVHVLLRSLPYVLDRCPLARLLIAESGIGHRRYRAEIQRLVRRLRLERSVTFMGRVDIREFLASIDVLAVPYLFSFGTMCFPNIVLEADRARTPVVSSDVEVMRELLSCGRIAVCSRVEDPEDLARGILLVLQGRDVRYASDGNAQADDDGVGPFLRLYESLLAGRSRQGPGGEQARILSGPQDRGGV